MSDLHLDTNVFLNDEFIIAPANSADCLVLCGDIGNPSEKYYSKLLEQASKLFKYTIVVAGNHEYYGYTFDQLEIQMRKISPSNVYFLNKTSIVLEGVRFLGCTLWSIVDDLVSFYINDYNLIYTSKNKDKITTEYIRNLHKDHASWLDTELERDKDTPTVIITHHAPDMRMNGKYLGNKLNSAFATDLPHLFRHPLKAWICGHTHQNITNYTNNIPCLSNCLGYENEDTNFDPTKTFYT